MRPPSEKTGADLALIQLLPNALTITAICAGLSAIRFGVQGNYVLAVQLILLACVLDGLDGRLARLLRSSSPMGAELDSLADFLNFGVAPPLILYFWALQDMRSAAWISVLIYAVCCVVRLARFNVNDKAEAEKAKNGDAVGESGSFFTGIPSPAGALLVLLPMTASFAFHNRPIVPDWMIAAHMVLIGFLMISRIPTWSFKTTKISRRHVKYLLVGVAIFAAALATYAWTTLVVLCVAYIGMVIWGLLRAKKTNKTKRI